MNYKLVVLREENSEFLALETNGVWRLPHIEIADGERIARTVTTAMRDRFGLESILLFGSNTEELDDCNRYFGAPYVVLEPINTNWSPPRDVGWIRRGANQESILEVNSDISALTYALELADAYNSGVRPGSFGRPGWINSVAEWIDSYLRPQNRFLTRHLQQLSGSPRACLIRFETTGSAVWFKAYDPRNTAGLTTTVALAPRHPRQIPRILATHDKWHWLLMEEVAGKRLDEIHDFEAWAGTLLEMSKLQRSHVADASLLVRQGFKDRRIDTVLSDIGPFFELMESVMARQPKTPPSMLTPSELRVLRNECSSACEHLLDGGIPVTLLHGDVGPHNVLISKDGPVFIDWSDASVSHPFLFCEYMLEFIERDHVKLAGQNKDLRRVYSELWREFATQRQIAEAFRLTPIVAPLFLALDTGKRVSTNHGNSSQYDKYLRSLVRLIKRRTTETHTMEAA